MKLRQPPHLVPSGGLRLQLTPVVRRQEAAHPEDDTLAVADRVERPHLEGPEELDERVLEARHLRVRQHGLDARGLLRREAGAEVDEAVVGAGLRERIEVEDVGVWHHEAALERAGPVLLPGGLELAVGRAGLREAAGEGLLEAKRSTCARQRGPSEASPPHPSVHSF